MSLKLRQHISRVKSLGGSDIKKSDRKNKLFAVEVDGKLIHFGDDRYTQNQNKKQRDAYRARHKAILKKDGTRAIDDKKSAAFWSYNLVWN